MCAQTVVYMGMQHYTTIFARAWCQSQAGKGFGLEGLQESEHYGPLFCMFCQMLGYSAGSFGNPSGSKAKRSLSAQQFKHCLAKLLVRDAFKTGWDKQRSLRAS